MTNRTPNQVTRWIAVGGGLVLGIGLQSSVLKSFPAQWHLPRVRPVTMKELARLQDGGKGGRPLLANSKSRIFKTV